MFKIIILTILMSIASILGAAKAYFDHRLRLELDNSIQSLDNYVHIDYSGIKTSLLASIYLSNLNLIAPDYPPIHINSIKVNKIYQLPQKLSLVLEGVKLTLNDTMSLISDIQIEAKFNQHNVLLLVLINGQAWGDIKLSMDLINLSLNWNNALQQTQLVSLNLIYDNQKLLNNKFKQKLIEQLDLSLTRIKLDTNILSYLRQFILNPKGLIIDLQPSMPIKIQELFYTSPKVLGLKINTN